MAGDGGESGAGPGGHGGRDAAKLAGGSGVVLAAGIVDRGIRLFITWYLSGGLGPVGFGLYRSATTVVSLVTAFAPLGLDSGVVYFGARYRQEGDEGRRKGVILLGLVLSVLSGLTVAAAVWAAPQLFPSLLPDDPAVGEVQRQVAPVVALWTPLLFVVGALRAVKDMRRSAVAYQLVLPLMLLLGTTVAVVGGWGVVGALFAFVLAHACSLAVGLWVARSHYLGLLRDRAVKAVIEPWVVLRYSIPQSLTAGVFRMNQWMDILMLQVMATSAEVGHYGVAASLAVVGAMPVNAVTSMFNPMISELVAAEAFDRLDALLKNVTRWLVILTGPGFAVMLLLPDVALGFFAEEYLEHSLAPLVVLLLGQCISVFCAPTMRLIPMSGHALLNLANGSAAAVLNIGLNLWLIPLHGNLGAAIATGTTLALWALWRVAEVRWLLGCFPFDGRTAGLIAFLATGGVGVYLLHLPMLARIPVTFLLVAAFFAVVWRFGRTPDDAVVVDRFRRRFNKLRGR